jgi:hypothetical protein
MTRSLHVALFALLALALSFGAPTEALAKGKQLYYRGQLMGSDGKPYYGLVSLQFSLHRRASGGKKIWSEAQYVSVENGSFITPLGARNAIPRKLNTAGLYVAMSIPNGPEFFREPFKEVRVTTARDFAVMKASAEGESGAIVVDAELGTGGAPPTRGGTSSYAEKAGMAYEAEHAKNAEKLDNMSLKDIERTLKERIKAKVGRDEQYAEHIGGHGGTPYFAQCPKGTVVVGIRGGAGKFVDGIQLICAPIE